MIHWCIAVEKGCEFFSIFLLVHFGSTFEFYSGFFQLGEVVLAVDFPEYFVESFSFFLSVFEIDYFIRTRKSVFFFSTGIANFREILIFLYKSSVRASADCERFGFVTCFLASFNIKRCEIVLLTFNFLIVLLSSEVLFWTFTFITKWWLLRGLSVTFQDRMVCIVRSNADFVEPVVVVSLPSFKLVSWFLLIKFKT